MCAFPKFPTVAEIEAKLGEVNLPFDDLAPPNITEWLDVLAKSHGTTKELLLISALTSTSALIAKSIVEVFATYEKKGNLFFIAVAHSGSGKTPACHLGCMDPIVEHLEPKIDKSIVVDEASSNILFNHFSSGDTVPILCIDEAHTFLSKILSLSKSPQANLTMGRLCKCFDGDCWYVLKGSKGKRTGVQSERVSLLAFTTPKQLLSKVWPKILRAENGLAERVLFYYQKMEVKDLEVMAEQCERLAEFPIKSLNGVLEQVYIEHTSEGPVRYTLSVSAREAFLKFSKSQDNVPLTQASIADEDSTHCMNSKRNKQVLRLSLHVLYDRLQKALNLQTGPTSHIINDATMSMAISMIECSEVFKGISEMACKINPSTKSIKIGVTMEEVTQHVLKMKGPYTTARRVYTSFSSYCRPKVSMVQAAMENLQASGLGTFKVHNKLKVLYKNLPTCDDLRPKLACFNISIEEYTSTFSKEDKILTASNVRTIRDGHPNIAEFEVYNEREIRQQLA